LIELLENSRMSSVQMQSTTNTPSWDSQPEHSIAAIEAGFYSGCRWKGETTEVFAYRGFPATASAATPVPAVVLVHGGEGTAFPHWVQQWVDRGYAAIAMDTCGCLPGDDFKFPHRPHPKGGPGNWGEALEDEAHLEPEEQWPYHGTNAVLHARAILAADPRVDASRIGVVGISWGGFLTARAASLDAEFAFAVAVYGCGFLQDDGRFIREKWNAVPQEKVDRWLELWDPKAILKDATMPFLWMNGTNDPFFPLSIWERSQNCLPHAPYRSVQLEWAHNNHVVFESKVIPAFADSICKVGSAKLPKLGAVKCIDGHYQSTIENLPHGATAHLLMTRGDLSAGSPWELLPASIDFEKSTVYAPVIPTAKYVILNIEVPDLGVCSNPTYCTF
jgi:dienelactone hydrolase